MMRLIEIRPSIYSWEDRIDSTKNATLLVHPFYIQYNHPEEYSGNERYFWHLNNFLRQHTGPIITLEERKMLRKTEKKFKSLRPFKNSFFIPTSIASPDPIDITWDELSDFLKEFDIDTLELTGGYYTILVEGRLFRGCLGVAEYELNRRNIPTRVIKELTFNDPHN